MATRVGVVLSGCGSEDGSEINETVLALYWIERAGGRAICMAPDVPQVRVVDHLTRALDSQASVRRAMAEAARIARGQVRDIATVKDNDVDALIFPGGLGVATVLSNYAEKGVVCEVHPEVTRLLKAMLQRRRPMGFICLAPILAARVLGPAAGVRITFGTKACEEAKHAAVMGADVRPCQLREILVDQKNRVVSTPAYMVEDARLSDVGFTIERLVREVFSLGRDRQPRPQPGPQPQMGQRQPRPNREGNGGGQPAATGVVVRKPGSQQPEGRGRQPEGRGRQPEGTGRQPEGGGRRPDGRGRQPEGGGRRPETGGRQPEAGGRPGPR
jgi:enhancing lycopene biosynthesis protein 2